ncbi:MAG: RNase H-like domain-containing protein [Candidatus Thiodiazotropha endolucinida]|nr:hypothetical protein [Candidatus Thiodiazotropha taylori]MCW4261381.1 RNase H-like domain-containing protein [Candidatus Thiodiazotropha endolucinida]
MMKSRTTPYRPMGNGMVERFNKTLLNMIGALTDKQKKDWKSHVQTLTHAYNAAAHESTGFSPFFLMFGSHPRLAIDAFLGLNPAEERKSHQDYANRLQEKLQNAYKKAGEEALKKGKKNKKAHKKPEFKWTENQQRAFEEIREKLSKPPVLAYFDYSLPFQLHTDASTTGLGAVFYQKQGGVDRVVSYASRGLVESERNYPAHKLEFLALKWAITEKFHDYLYGSSFEVYTDNNPLTYIFSTAKLDATGQRWIAALSNYNCPLKYRSGKKNIYADGLSRKHECIMPPQLCSLTSLRLYV